MASGGEDFAYAGDSAADRPIWEAAAANILVNAPGRDVRRARSANKAEMVIESRPAIWRAFLKEMRPHQYAKNLLIFVALLTSHGYSDWSAVLATLWAFLCFSACASGVYFLNDLVDLDSDRRHPTKRRRPLASGELPLRVGIAGALALPIIAVVAATFLLPPMFVAVLVAYYLITNLYSLFVKSISTADVMVLAILYTTRVVAGAAAAGVVLSSWLMAFSVFIFVSLAYLKRYIEISEPQDNSNKAHGRGYTTADSESMFALGIANITASVVVLALYINSEEVTSLYRSPEILWLLCLLLLYWGNRTWVGARRGKIAEDPVVFAITDRVSQMVAVGFVLVALAARYLG